MQISPLGTMHRVHHPFPPSAAHEVSCALDPATSSPWKAFTHYVFLKATRLVVRLWQCCLWPWVPPLWLPHPARGVRGSRNRELYEWLNRQTDLKSYRAGDQPTRSPCRSRFPNVQWLRSLLQRFCRHCRLHSDSSVIRTLAVSWPWLTTDILASRQQLKSSRLRQSKQHSFVLS